jgi:hypothetical protein
MAAIGNLGESQLAANFGRSALLSIAAIGRCRGCRYVFSSARRNLPGADAVISDEDLLVDPFEPLIRRKRPHRTRPFIARFRNYCRDSQAHPSAARNVIGRIQATIPADGPPLDAAWLIHISR